MARKSFAILSLTLAALLGLSAPGLRAAEKGLVQIRVEDGGKKALVEVPASVLDFLDRHAATREFKACRMEGRTVTLSFGDMMKALKETSPGGETLLLTVEEGGQKKTVSLAVVPEGQARPGKAPREFVLSLREKGAGGEPKDMKVRLPIATVEAVLKGVKIESEGPDPSADLIRDVVPFARELGTGLLFHVLSDEGEVLVSLE